MIGASYTVEIRAPPTIVWETTCDIDSFPEHISDCQAVVAVGSTKVAPLRPGSKWTEYRLVEGRVVPVTLTATTVDQVDDDHDTQQKQLRFFAELWGCDLSVTFTLKPVSPEKCRLTNSYGIVPRSLVARIIFSCRRKALGKKIYQSIKSDLEGMARSAETKAQRIRK